MASALIHFSSQLSKLLVSKNWWKEGSLLAVFAVAAVSAWSWRIPFLTMTTTTCSSNLNLETSDSFNIFDNNPTNLKTHLIVLVHGFMGNALEMNYVQQALEQEWKPHSSQSRLVVHSSKCNEGRTSDGIEAGGSRLAAEVNQLLKRFREQPGSDKAKLYFSMVGNSLGGLYARHALSLIDWHLIDEPLVFVTTATPHLGVSSHTYIPLNRGMEWLVANTLQQTGRDLFLRNRVVEQLGTDPKYLQPLQRFRRRIAYANSFGVDFQVPTATAGFLSPTSTSKHAILTPPSSPTSASSEPFIVLTAQTPSTNKRTPLSFTRDISSRNNNKENVMQTLVENLDALGWTKVFCDVRESLPAISLPSFRRLEPEHVLSSSRSVAETVDRVATSKELHNLLTKPRGSKWHFPGGHTVLIANSKSEYYANLNKWGRPVMDRLARDILADLVNSNDNINDSATCTQDSMTSSPSSPPPP